jgi:hypothetical protein
MPAMRVSRRAAQGGARLGLCPPRAAPAWRHTDALMLLWEEYRQPETDGSYYSRGCELYRAW